MAYFTYVRFDIELASITPTTKIDQTNSLLQFGSCLDAVTKDNEGL